MTVLSLYWEFIYSKCWSLYWDSDLGPHVTAVEWSYSDPGGRLNKKDGLSRYGDYIVKDKTS